MAEYLCEADMSTGEYISRDEALKIFHQCCDNCTSSYNGVMCRACADAGAMDILIDMPAADVKPVKYSSWEYHTYPIVDVNGVARRCMKGYVCKACGHGEPEKNASAVVVEQRCGMNRISLL